MAPAGFELIAVIVVVPVMSKTAADESGSVIVPALAMSEPFGGDMEYCSLTSIARP